MESEKLSFDGANLREHFARIAMPPQAGTVKR